jgi:hypothetical protein
MWYDLLKNRNTYLQRRQMKIKNGNGTIFWKDAWLYDKPLNVLFPDLLKICEQPDISVCQVKIDPNSLSFSRWLVDDLKSCWEQGHPWGRAACATAQGLQIP